MTGKTPDILFKDIELSDSAWIRELLSVPDFNSEDYCFTFQYLWKNTFKSKVAKIGDIVLIQYNMGFGRSYLMPVGKADNWQIADLLNAMLSTGTANSQSPLLSDGYSCQNSMLTAGGNNQNSLLTDDGKLVLYGVLPSQLDFFERHFSGMYTAELFRMGADYIYDAESLKTLRGKKYQSKRNFANGFRRLYNWRFEPITEENVPECLAMNDEWCRRGGCSGDFWKSNEFCATRVALNNFKALGLDGGLLRVDGKVVAFSIAEKANSNTLIVHIEKALTEYRGAYQAMSQEFLNHLAQKYEFTLVNREDDSGDENLRKAKLEYHPVEIKEKYLVTLGL
ncbi:MAG: DUF2156 domain-containing protein [Bacteroidales bacterium]|nr:DUF2156 domain-containing protein [Bacteroidales bacterium]